MGRITHSNTTHTTKPKRHVVAKATALIIRILPTAIFVTALTGSIVIGYLAQINIPSSLSSSSSSASVKRIPRLRIGAYYRNWDNHQQEATKFHETTSLGGLNDDSTGGSKTNSTVVAAAWAKHSQKFQHQAGIDFFIMSWGSTQEQHDMIKQYMQHPKTIRIALNIESLALYYKSRVSNLTQTQQQQQQTVSPSDDKQNYTKTKDDTIVIDFQQPCINVYPKQNQMVTTFGETFISYIIKVMKDIVVRYRNKYLFVGDRPVFVLGHTYQFINHEAYIDRIRRFFKTRFGVQPYFIADMVQGVDVDHDILKKRTKISGRNKFDSITGYNRLDFDGLLQKDESKLNENLLRIETEYLRFSNPFRSWWDFLFIDDDTTTERSPVVPYVHVPGYYDDNNDNSQQQQDQSQIYDKFWDLAERLLDHNPCLIKSDEWFVFLGLSFNEPHESNHYLQITKERGKSLYPACA